jgi:hypothetical protein
MRTADRRVRAARSRALVAVLATAGLVAACGAVESTPVAPAPTPVPSRYAIATPFPPMIEPAAADAVYLALLADGLFMTPVESSTGGPGKDPVKRVNATYKGWPLVISQYRSSKTLQTATHWKTGVKPGAGEAPIGFIGLNILVQYGPIGSAAPTAPDDRQLAASQTLRGALERLLPQLRTRTIVPVAIPTPSARSASPSAVPSQTPAPSTEASAKS